ncbi:MAG: ATP-binding protein [Methylobacteriaceae bacterium]|jgi:predicted AAA+ superfamily ATPase|nr:ATP-binding protein [Methylobacteriaceae bacterium]
MEYISRDIEPTILDAAGEYAALIVTGPRQTGKTTTLRRLADGGRAYVTLDDIEARRLARNDPELFLSLNPAPVLIDEVQYAPELFPRIKIEIDKGAAAGSYWMTGSQSFHLMELARESLAGRVAVLSMSSLSQHEIYGRGGCPPFTVSLAALGERTESGSRTDAKGQFERIWRGSMPGHVSGKFAHRERFYSSYVQTYIQRDIGDMLTRVDALQFEDFIRAAACRAGQLLNTHEIAADVGVTDNTAKRWLAILEKSSVIFYLRPYSNNLLKRTIKAPKMYFFDTGLVAWLTKYSTPDILMNGAINGAILENYVVAEIIKSYANNGLNAGVHYWRDKDGKEIDLILEHDGVLHPIEIKKAASPSAGIARTFKVLDNARLPRGTGAVVCTRAEVSAIDRETLLVPVWTL